MLEWGRPGLDRQGQDWGPYGNSAHGRSQQRTWVGSCQWALNRQTYMWHGHMQSEPNQTLMNEPKIFQVFLAYFRAKINHDRIWGEWFLSVLHRVWVYFPWSCFWLNSLKYDLLLTTCDMGHWPEWWHGAGLSWTRHGQRAGLASVQVRNGALGRKLWGGSSNGF